MLSLLLCSTTRLRKLSLRSTSKLRSMFSVCELKTSTPGGHLATGATARKYSAQTIGSKNCFDWACYCLWFPHINPSHATIIDLVHSDSFQTVPFPEWTSTTWSANFFRWGRKRNDTRRYFCNSSFFLFSHIVKAMHHNECIPVQYLLIT